MALTTRTEGPRDLAFVLAEGNGSISREVVTIVAGSGVLKPGAVLGQITASKKHAPSQAAVVVGQEGAETARAVLAYGVDATAADVEAVVIARLAEVKEPMLVFHASVDQPAEITAKLTQLAAATIIAR